MNKLQLKLKQLAFVFFLLISGNALAQKDTLSFLHITDLHVIFEQDIYQRDLAQSRYHYRQGEDSLRYFLQTMPEKTNSNLVVATGDLVDFFEAEMPDGKMLGIQAEQFTRLVSNCHVPVLLALGNHDSFTFNWQDNKLKYNQNNSGRARAAWVRNSSCFKDGTYYSRIFQVGKTTYRLIFLDDSFYKFLPDDKVEIPYVDKPQLSWLNAQLHESDDDIEIVLMHIPFKEIVTQPGLSNELFSILSKNPSTRLILAGHNHKNVITDFSTVGNKMVQVQTGAFAINTDNWRQIRLTEKNILVSVPGKTEKELVVSVK